MLIRAPAGLDLGGWTLQDESASHRLRFTAGTGVGTDGRLRIYSSCGAQRDGVMFWCRKGSSVWNNAGDTAFLLDPNGNVASRLESGRPGVGR